MTQSQGPIGFFDSGLGGTSVWKESISLLPHENTLYLADSKNAPYGGKSKEEIIALSEKNTELLLEMDAKLIVVACNTATTNAIAHLRSKYDVPFVGIEPAIKPAALHTRSGKVGLLATRGTLSSDLFAKTSRDHASHIEVIERVGEGLVELIEEGKIYSPEMKTLLTRYLTPIRNSGADHLILGCTHYPYLIPQIKEVIGEGIKIIDSGYAVARQIKRLLLRYDMLNDVNQPAVHKLYTNASPERLQNILRDVSVPYHAGYLDF